MKQDAARRARERAAGLSTDAAAFADEDEGDLEGGDDAGGAAQQDAAALERAYRKELAKEVAAAAAAEEEEGEEGGESGSEEGAEEGAAAAAAAAAAAERRQVNGGGAEDEEGLAAMMMSRKQRKFYERIKRAQAGKAERVGALEARKAALDEQEGKAPAAAPAGGRTTRASAKRAQDERIATIEPTMKKRRP